MGWDVAGLFSWLPIGWIWLTEGWLAECAKVCVKKVPCLPNKWRLGFPSTHSHLSAQVSLMTRSWTWMWRGGLDYSALYCKIYPSALKTWVVSPRLRLQCLSQGVVYSVSVCSYSFKMCHWEMTDRLVILCIGQQDCATACLLHIVTGKDLD